MNSKRQIRFLSLVLLVWLMVPFASIQAQIFYGHTISVETKFYSQSANVKKAVDDLKNHLKAATGEEFTVEQRFMPYPAGNTMEKNIGIIKLSKAGATYDKRLDSNSYNDAVLLHSDGEYLRIVSYTDQGIINGIYTYLDMLGFRWYRPGAAWTYVPKLTDIGLKCDQLYVPDFTLRTYFGTFGIPKNTVVDKTRSAAYEWDMWYLRNRFGSSYILKGHAWNDFLWRNRKALQAHPEYMAMINGKRVNVTTASKFCISNEGFRKLFVEDMEAQLQKAYKAYPGANLYCISVEPSDGGGDCQCDACKKMGSVSDRVFSLANDVARVFQKQDQRAFVNLYAYNTHAVPPVFDLLPNVIVQIIPYKYQNYASPEKMIEQWQKKTTNLFIYDYYGLPLTSLDKPLSGKPELLADKIKYWHQQHIKGVTLESSYSIGATCAGLYLYARLGFDVKSDATALMNEYYTFSFGKAAEAVKRTAEILVNNPGTVPVITRAIQLLHNETAGVELDSAQHTRLVDYKVYLHYLKLLYQFPAYSKLDTAAASDQIMDFVFGNFYRMMIHPYPIAEHLKNDRVVGAYIKTNWDYTKPAAEGMKFATIKHWTNEQIEKAFEDDVLELK